MAAQRPTNPDTPQTREAGQPVYPTATLLFTLSAGVSADLSALPKHPLIRLRWAIESTLARRLRHALKVDMRLPKGVQIALHRARQTSPKIDDRIHHFTARRRPS